MQPSAKPEKRKAATPVASVAAAQSTLTARSRAPQFARNYSANALPPSTVIRSRFRSITENLPTGTHGAKRQMVDYSPSATADNASAWPLSLETPIRATSGYASAAAPLVDTLLRPQRLFAHISPLNDSKTPVRRGAGNHASSVQQSPARSILESAHRESESIGKLEALRRDAERAKFELRQAETDREHERIDAKRTQQRLEADLAAQTKRIDKLERDRKWLFDQEEQLAEQRRAVEREMSAQRTAYEARIDEMAESARELEQRLDDAHRAMRRLKADHADQTDNLQTRLSRAERTVAELQATDKKHHDGGSADAASMQYMVDSMKRDLHTRNQDIEELQHRLRAALSSEDANGDDTATLPLRERAERLERDLREQCEYIKAVEQQNNQLRSKAQSLTDAAAKYERERELARSLQAKVDRLERRQEEYAEAEARVTALQQERDQWNRVFQETGDASKQANQHAPCSPFAAAKTMTSQKHRIQMLETKLQSLQDARDSDDQQLQRIVSEAQTYKLECARLESILTAENTRIFKLDTSRQHAVREAEFLRSQLHSYDCEEASFMAGNYDHQKTARIEQLEKFIDEQRTWIASLESFGGTPNAATSTSHSGLETVSASLLQGYRKDAETKQSELDGLRDEHQRLIGRYDELEKEAARLEHQVGAGLGYDPRTTRILQLIDNPAAQDYAIRSEKLAAMSSENEALLERIRQLEKQQQQQLQHTSLSSTETGNLDDGSADDTASSPFFHTIDNLRTENQSLTKQLEDSVKLISRYKREWKRKAAELRDVVYVILGYRVDFLTNGSVRFTSTYAADVDQSFVFTSGDDNQGIMQLTGGGSKTYLKSLTNDIRYWVQERGSIPGFMATITLQSFEAQLDQAQ
ncbi:coiled-coil domain-containing protein mad1 [Coemansia sp. RSA 2399]|nr:coiled-coil domain-containing protein mad1 [Coemansia sp. RSA 2399]KAJ1908212.1 coiled-coil domain-containing protein mad1 [Coemansia sp. IMI 209127]